MLRLNKKDIRKAYNQTGCKACYGMFYKRSDNNSLCACPIGALALANGVTTTKDSYTRREHKAYVWAMSQFGDGNVEKFIDGFDAYCDFSVDDDLYDTNRYYKLGCYVAAKLTGKFD